MTQLIVLPVLLITLLLGTPACTAYSQKGLDAFQRGDYETALREWRPLAEQGDAFAQTALGGMYHYGKGAPQNNKTAFKWFRLAAKQGNVLAQYSLGEMYAKGEGVIRDYSLAHMWWNIAVSQGVERAKKNRDWIEKKMSPSQIEIAKKLASECVMEKYKGCGRVAREEKEQVRKKPKKVAADFQKGLDAYKKKDYETALREWKLAAEQGDARAQNNLGQMYRRGQGVTQNNKTAVKWYTLAAEQGDADAQLGLGWMCYKGLGVSQDNKTAVKWYTLAAEQGDALAQYYLRELEEQVRKKP